MFQIIEKIANPFCHIITLSNAKISFLGINDGKSVSFWWQELNDLGKDSSEKFFE